MGLLDALLTVIVISIVCYIVIMMYRRSCVSAPAVQRNKDLLPPGASSFEDKMTDDQVRAFHALVTSSPGDNPAPAPTAESPVARNRFSAASS
ncbi:virion membrane protein [Orf virus]|uniref:Virion membrane protein n=1 Tax=Orf virus TaxID=10258 RepID=A0A0F6N1R3_ORFV|nr:virion membrane protein [Orf virus]ASY92385.1 virion membrane protein [Orf virus]WGD01259.1 virion membrane protein [Orf virus]